MITSGTTTVKTTSNDPEYSRILQLVEAAVASEIPLVQLREKTLSAKVLYELACSAVSIARGSQTRLLINDRFDVALGSKADGVQLTSQSIETAKVRSICGNDFLVGVSTHSLKEARAARDEGADFVLFGPIFDTQSKRGLGAPQGIDKLREVASELKDFPVIAIGGVTVENARECLRGGAAGIAAIGLFADPLSFLSVVAALRDSAIS